MSLQVRKAAVLGAGVMGAQIAVHMVNADIPVVLFDLTAKEGDPSGVAKRAIENLKKLSPPPGATRDRVGYIEPANYDQHLEKLRDCDLVIEAIAERMDWKLDLYKRISPYVKPDIVLASNTSGLSIEEMGRALPEALRSRFCGLHFFNPPRYMTLLELIPVAATDPALADGLEAFLTTVLGKGVVRAFDTPNFIANRIGVFSMLAVFYHTQELGLSFDAADAVTGPLIGRAPSATFRTADVVGFDTMSHVVKGMNARLGGDPWHKYYEIPAWQQAMIDKGVLGNKTGFGVYKRDGKTFTVFDPAKQGYVPSGAKADPGVETILDLEDPVEKMAQLRQSTHPQAQLVWRSLRDLFHYSAYHLADVADNARDLDLGARWGYGWREGPFETWQTSGWEATAAAIRADVEAGKAMAGAPLPAWVFDGRKGVHSPQGSYSGRDNAVKPRSTLPVYRRQHFPEPVVGEEWPHGNTIFETDAVRMWTTAAPRSDDVAVLSFKSKANVIGPDVAAGIIEALRRAETNYKGLVIWQAQPPFSAGANLSAVSREIEKGAFDAIDRTVVTFQQMTSALKYAQVPTIAAVNGTAVGGGCEIAMHCARAVVALESRLGLVEADVGLVPGGGGLKEFASRAAKSAGSSNINDPLLFLTAPFQAISAGKVAANAIEAREMGFLRDADVILFNPNELLYVAQQIARGMYEAGYRPALPPLGIRVAGRGGIATLEATLTNMLGGGMITEHDYRVGKGIAAGLCGGEVDSGSVVAEDWLLSVERRQFVELTKTEKTQARIKNMLETGKALRN
jgi:3-hydroxyacyl-CoA dehydrogenase